MYNTRDKYYCLRMIPIYLIILIILIESPTMFRFITTSPIYGKGFERILQLLCLLYIAQTPRSRLNCSISVRLPILLVLLSLYAFATGYKVNKFLTGYVVTFLFLFLFAYALYQNGDMRAFFQAFSNIMLVIAVISLLFWLFGSILHVIPGRTELTYFWANAYKPTYSYFGVYFENPAQNAGFSIIRNMGVFCEAPGYANFLTYALLIELVFRKEVTEKREKRQVYLRLLLFVITMLTTSSTKGIIIVLIAVAFEYLTAETRSKWQAAAKLFVGAIIIVGVIYATYTLVGAKLETGSGLTRMDDLNSQFKTFLQHPLFGAGYGNVQEIVKNQLRVRASTGLSMGLTVLLAYGGLWLTAIYAGAMVVSYRNIYFKENRKTWLLIVIVLVYNLFISHVAFTEPYIFIIAAAYAFPVGEALQTRGYLIDAAA